MKWPIAVGGCDQGQQVAMLVDQIAGASVATKDAPGRGIRREMRGDSGAE